MDYNSSLFSCFSRRRRRRHRRRRINAFGKERNV